MYQKNIQYLSNYNNISLIIELITPNFFIYFIKLNWQKNMDTKITLYHAFLKLHFSK